MMKKTNTNMKGKIESTLATIDSIQEVKVSPFFKDKTMKRLFSKKQEEESYVWSWFTPKIQLAMLACIVVLNIFAFSQLKQDAYEDEMSQFVESYGFSTSNETSLIN